MIKTILFALVSVIGISCSGNIDLTQTTISFKSDKGSIAADGSDKVVFSVRYADEDVTSQSNIICVSNPSIKVENAQFSTTSAGNYVFQAEYNGELSEKITIKAEQSAKPSKPSQFVRKVLVMEFTGQWCNNCPTGFNYLYSTQQLYFKDNTFIMAMHNQDDFTIPDVQAKVESAFSIPAYPSAVIDCRDYSPLTGDTQAKLKSSINASLKEHPAHCGVAVSSAFDKESKKATVTVKVMPEISASFRVAVWIVEDDVVGWQKMGAETEQNYHHSHVARKLVTKNWRGDLLPDAEADKEIVSTYEVDVPYVNGTPAWNLDNTTVYAVVFDDASDENAVFVNNVEICKFVDGNTDYSYIKK